MNLPTKEDKERLKRKLEEDKKKEKKKENKPDDTPKKVFEIDESELKKDKMHEKISRTYMLKNITIKLLAKMKEMNKNSFGETVDEAVLKLWKEEYEEEYRKEQNELLNNL